MEKNELEILLIKIENLRDSLNEMNFNGTSLSNLPSWVWEDFGDIICDIKNSIENGKE